MKIWLVFVWEVWRVMRFSLDNRNISIYFLGCYKTTLSCFYSILASSMLACNGYMCFFSSCIKGTQHMINLFWANDLIPDICL